MTLRLLFGGAVCGSLLGIFAGALLGTIYGGLNGNVSIGLDGALFGGCLGGLAGAIVVGIFEVRHSVRSSSAGAGNANMHHDDGAATHPGHVARPIMAHMVEVPESPQSQ